MYLKNKTYKNHIGRFQSWLQTLGYAKSTVTGSPAYVNEFLFYLEKNNITAINQIGNQVIKDYFIYLSRRKNSKKAGAYVYRIALTANSRAWRNRIGRNGQFARSRIGVGTDPIEKIGRIEQAAKVRRAISQLPPKQGRAIVMRYLEQHDYETISEKLCCSKASARSHVSKALATLKDKLATLA